MKRWVIAGLLVWSAAQGRANQIVGPTVLNAGSNPRGICSADLYGDGQTEIIVANFGAPTLIGQSTTNSASPSIEIFKDLRLYQSLPSGHSPRSLFVSDINHDGLPDILCSFYDDNAIGYYQQRSDHSFAPPQEIPVGNHPVGLCAFNVSATSWVAVANYGGNSISLFQISVSGSFNCLTTLACPSNPTDVSFVWPSDGVPQLWAADYGANELSSWNIGPGNSISARHDLPMEGNPCRIAFGHLDGSGRLDMAVALFSESKVAIFADSGGSFGGTPTFVSLGGQHPNGLAIGKVAGQSTPLVVVACRDSDEIDLVGLGSDGTFKVLSSFSVKVGQGQDSQYGPVEVAIGDFGGSGYLGFASSHMRGGLVHVFSQEAPAAPQISSSTHPDSSQYYSGNQAQFAWTAPLDFDGIDHYTYSLDQNSGASQDSKTQSTSATQASFSNLATGTYYLHVNAVDKAGDIGSAGIFKIGVTAAMSSDNTYNFPNPSTTGQTTIRFALDSPQAVQIRIYDEVSALVWTKDLSSGQTIAGVNYVTWNGENDRGMTVGNGGYILQVKAGSTVVTKKIAIVR